MTLLFGWNRSFSSWNVSRMIFSLLLMKASFAFCTATLWRATLPTFPFYRSLETRLLRYVRPHYHIHRSTDEAVDYPDQLPEWGQKDSDPRPPRGNNSRFPYGDKNHSPHFSVAKGPLQSEGRLDDSAKWISHPVWTRETLPTTGRGRCLAWILK
jgi:hypothetical protein